MIPSFTWWSGKPSPRGRNLNRVVKQTNEWWVVRGPEFQSWVSSSLWSATFCELLKLKLPSPWSPHLPARSENTSCFGRSGVMPVCMSASQPVSQGLGFLALCLWLRGTKLVWFGVANGSIRVELCAVTLSLSWVPYTAVASLPRMEVPSRDLPSLVSYLTSSLHFLLLTLSSPCPDL